MKKGLVVLSSIGIGASIGGSAVLIANRCVKIFNKTGKKRWLVIAFLLMCSGPAIAGTIAGIIFKEPTVDYPMQHFGEDNYEEDEDSNEEEEY